MTDSATPSVPVHIGFVLDGNRRWAKAQGLPTMEGHRKGYENLKDIARAAYQLGVKYVSAYVFSTENWNRTKEEVSYLMNFAIKVASKDVKELIEEGVRVVVLGLEERVDPKIVKIWREVEEESKNNTKGTLAVCFNYGGTSEIAEAVKKIVQEKVDPSLITEETVAKHLFHPEVPAVDLLVRTSGEQRISNFMLWRAAYSELYFVDKHWPDFNTDDLKTAIEEYQTRNRRFGGD